jgi:hypothetical protein
MENTAQYIYNTTSDVSLFSNMHKRANPAAVTRLSLSADPRPGLFGQAEAFPQIPSCRLVGFQGRPSISTFPFSFINSLSLLDALLLPLRF